MLKTFEVRILKTKQYLDNVTHYAVLKVKLKAVARRNCAKFTQITYYGFSLLQCNISSHLIYYYIP